MKRDTLLDLRGELFPVRGGITKIIPVLDDPVCVQPYRLE
jgi:hypothetical protein